MPIKTSLTDPIHVTEITHPEHSGIIGVSICPGKKSPSTFGGVWDRDLATDLEAIQNKFNPTAIVTLMPHDELDVNKVANIGDAVVERDIRWFHIPIKDMNAPDHSFNNFWSEIGPKIIGMIKQGDNVLIHCKGGLGRSGTIAALILIELGISNDEAIIQVRQARPGAIDIADQEKYILQYSRINPFND